MPPLRSGKKRIDASFVEGSIPGNEKFGFSDLDLISERDGRFLVIECKSPGDELSRACLRLLRTLAYHKNFTVLVVQITGNQTISGALDLDPISYAVVTTDGLGKYEETNKEQFLKGFKKWYHGISV